MKKEKKWLYITVLWTLFMWGQSCLPASVSSAESGVALDWFHHFRLTKELTMHLLRKGAHCAEYAIFAVLVGIAVQKLLVANPLRRWIRLTAGLFVPLMDETIQLVIPGRSGQVTDLWIDIAGECLGALVLLLILRIRRRKKGGFEHDMPEM